MPRHCFELSRPLIPFNKPHTHPSDVAYVRDAANNHRLSGDGPYTRRCHDWLQQQMGSGKALVTTSGTSALESVSLPRRRSSVRGLAAGLLSSGLWTE